MGKNKKLGFVFPLSGMVFKDDGVTAPTQVLMTGEWTSSKYGKIQITESDLDTMIKNFQDNNAQELCVDYQHMSSDDDPEKAIASGWMRKLFKKNNEEEDRVELWAETEWTGPAAERIKNKEYRYISPEFMSDYKNPDTGKKQGATLLAAALTNRPFLKGMSPVVLCEGVIAELQEENVQELIKLADESMHDQIRKVSSAYFEKFPRDNNCFDGPWIRDTFDTHIIVEKGDILTKVPYMVSGDDFEFGEAVEVEQVYQEKTIKSIEGGVKMDRKLLCEQLGLKETATDDEIKVALKKLTDAQSNKELVVSLNLKEDATAQEISEAVVKLKEASSQAATEEVVKLAEFNQLKEDHAGTKKLAEGLEKKNDALELTILEADRNKVIGTALKEGKLLPKHKEVWEKKFMENPEGTRELLATLEKPVVSLTEDGGAGDGSEGGTVGAQISLKCSEKMEANKGMTFKDAFNAVQTENPELAKEYAKELKS